LSKYYFSERGVANKVLKLSERKSNNSFDISEIYKKLRVPKNKKDIEHNIIGKEDGDKRLIELNVKQKKNVFGEYDG